jgi:hypothetical protein
VGHEVGDMLDERYKLLEVIGSGGQGEELLELFLELLGCDHALVSLLPVRRSKPP